MDSTVLALAMLGAIAWGAQNYVGAVVSRHLSAVRIALSTQAIGFLFIAPIAFAGPGSLTSSGMQWGTIAAITGVFGWVFMYAAAAVGQIAVTQKLISGTAAVLPFVVGVATGFRPGLFTVFGLVLIVMSLVLLSVHPMKSTEGGPQYHPRSAVIFAFVAGVCLGSALVALGHTTPGDGIYPFAVYRLDGAFILLVVAFLVRVPVLPPRRYLGRLAATAMFSTIGDVAVILALQHGSFSLVPAITSLFPGVTALLAYWLAKERLGRLQALAIIVGLAGVVLLQN